MPLLEKVRTELLPDPIYSRLLEGLSDELSGCRVTPTQGKYRLTAGSILHNKINILFTDTPLYLDKRISALIPKFYSQRKDTILK
jgi:hypothetical protein